MTTAFETVTCAYDPTHQIQPHRVNNHYMKCRKQHGGVDYSGAEVKICPHNSNHHIKAEEFRKHVDRCPTRYATEHAMRVFDKREEPGACRARAAHPVPASANKAQHLVVKGPPAAATGVEDWEAEANVTKSYDPWKATEGRRVIRNPQHLHTKRERDEFYRNEVIRFSKIDAEEKAANSKQKK